MRADPAQDRRARLAFLSAAGAVLLVALVVRLAGAAQAYAGGLLVTLDGDSLYHLRRMRLIADAFPAVPWIDPMIAWPHGAPIPWAAGFDVLGAAMILLGRTLGGERGGDLWVASLCPILGVLVVAAVMELVHALRPGAPGRWGAALAAGLLAAVIPQGLAISRFGRIDHHVAEALAMLLLARWAIAALPPRGQAGPGRRLAFELAGGLLAGGAVAVFTGSPLYVALVLPVLAGAAVAAPRPPLLGSGGPGLLLGAALAALASAPAVAATGKALAFGFPSWLQPLLLAAAGGALVGVVLVARLVPPGWRRLAAAAAGVFAVASLAVLVAPQAAGQALAAIREWLLKSDPWLRGIDEFQPLLRHPGGPAAGVSRFFGVAGFAAPLLLPLAALGVRPAGPARAAAFLGLVAALAGLTLLQSRFGRVFAPFLAASGGLGLAWLASRLAPRSRLASVAPVAAVLALALLDPRVRATVGGTPDPIPDAALEAALDLGQRPAGASPGVQAPWDLANQFLVVAGRPVVSTGFGPYPDPAAYWEGVKAYSVGEDVLLPWLAWRRIGWVVAGAANLFARVEAPDAPIPFEHGRLSETWLRQVASSPLLLGGSGVPAAGVPHFAHLMPVFASTRQVGGIDAALPVLWTYQVVAGARLEGRSAPGARVLLEIPLVEQGHPLAWRAAAAADAHGRWSLVVPLPTDLATATLRTGPGQLLVGEGPPRQIGIPEGAVRSGRVIAVGAPAR